MSNEEISPQDIYAQAQRVFSAEEWTHLPVQLQSALCGMFRRRLQDNKEPPTLAELQGIRELATEHLWHPALNGMSQTSLNTEEKN
jgi:hypothetical protein